MSKALVKFIKQYLDQGYDIDSIKNHLLNSGYNLQDINASINQLYSTEHAVHHLSKTTVITLAAIILGIVVIIASIMIYIKPAQEAILDIDLESIQTTVRPNQEIIFIRELTNFGKEVDVAISYTLISVDTAEIITTHQETAAVETKASSNIKIRIPNNAPLGNAILNAIATYEDKEAKAALAVKIYQESAIPTCTDNIQNQGEEAVDCGGICPKCKEEKSCPVSCNDYDQCTEDYCNQETDFECRYRPIIPCCGNSICENTETPEKCSRDCIEQQTDPFEGLTPQETLDKIEKIAETDIRSASNYCQMIGTGLYRDSCFRNIAEISKNALFCDKIELELSKDRCYSSVAQSKSDSSVCENIDKDTRRDSCYMNFVLDQKDYSVCGKLVNKYLRDSCQTLKEAG